MHSLPNHHSKSMGFANDAACQASGAVALMWLNRVINTIPQSIYWKDQNNQFLGCNQAFANAAGLTHSDAILGKSVVELPGNMRSQLLSDRDRVVLDTNQPEHHIVELTDVSDRPTWVSIQKLPLQNDAGNAIGVVCTIEDITAEKQAELKLQQSEAVILAAQDSTETNEAEHLKGSQAFLMHVLNEVDNRTAALRESEARLRTLMANLPIGVWATDANARYIVQNPTALEQWGDLVGKQPQDLDLPSEVSDTWLEECRRVLAGEIIRKEDCHRRGDDDWFYSTILAPIWDGDRIVGLLGVAIDITEQKRTEAALRENEDTLRGILQNMPVMMDAFDEHGTIITWNSECERVTGYRAHEIIGNPNAMELLYADSVYREQMVQTWARLGNNFRNWEWKIWCKDGTIKTILWSNLSGQFPVAGWAGWGIGIDISDRKQAELQLQASENCLRQQAQELTDTLKELQRTQSQLVQSEKMSSLGQLVAGVAHEINNPVNFIYGNLSYADEYVSELLDLLELYQQEYSTPTIPIQDKIEAIDLSFLLEDLPKLLNSMKVGAERIQAIVASLRTFSRMDEAEVKAVDIHEGIDSTLMILQSRIKGTHQRGAISVVKNYGDLPLVECYAGQLNQVFMNIFSNAIDALEEKIQSCAPHSANDALEESSQFSISNASSSNLNIETQNFTSPYITIHTEKLSPDRVVISINDNGTGIPDSVQQRLFDPFFTTKEVGKGTGMGLSISYQIVTEKHGGSLNCVSTPGQGAEFRIEIPISQCST